jgi:bifunctional UDP-N-acetylglucosamine pyrophosphorylase/glucosamine-1-phosphate N-acetyltransferase
MRDVGALLDELKTMMATGKEFRFWEYLESGEKLVEEASGNIEGTIEENVSVAGKLVLGGNSVVKAGSRIEGSVVIGSNCIIGPNAFLRNGTIIADNCHIGSSEIKNSIILSNSKIPHFSYVGDSVVGENVNFGAGTKVANLRFDNASVSVVIGGEKIDSGRRKLGALVGHNVKTGINCSINCGVIIGNNCLIFPGRVVSENLREGGLLR